MPDITPHPGLRDPERVNGVPARRPALPGGSRELKIVIAHDFAETYGGAERVIAEIADLYPNAEFWTILGRKSVARRMGVEDRFHSLLPEREWLLARYRWLAPLFPWLVRAIKLPEADVLITSSYAFANGFRTRNRAPQVCFCHSPLRFAWSMTSDYRDSIVGDGAIRARLFGLFARLMRMLDRRAARNVSVYLTESDFTADQVSSFYGMPAVIAGGPVDCGLFRPSSGEAHNGYYLFCGRLVEAYKRPSVVVEAFRDLPENKLVVVGDGPALPALREAAGPNVEFVGHVDDGELIPLMQRCVAAIFPSRDDFGLIPVEVMACGRPVIAFAGGGALRTVVPGHTGEFFAAQTPEAIAEAVRAFDPDRYDPKAIREHARHWDSRHFRHIVREAVESAIAPAQGGSMRRHR